MTTMKTLSMVVLDVDNRGNNNRDVDNRGNNNRDVDNRGNNNSINEDGGGDCGDVA